MIFWMYPSFISFLAAAAVLTFIIPVGLYLFFAYVMTRIGRKFGIGSFVEFLIPVYNIILLCDCAKINRWVTAAIVLPFFSGSLGILTSIIGIIWFGAHVYLWGKIAERLGRSFWLWGILTPFFGGFPAIILAFDGSMPPEKPDSFSDETGTKYIEI